MIFGTPVYFSYPTGEFRSFIERLGFAAHSYDKDENGVMKRVLEKTIPMGIIFTMNCPEQYLEKYNYKIILDDNTNSLRHVFGYAESLYSCDTYQFDDYSKYNANYFDEKHKAEFRDKQFPIDLQKAYELGERFAKGI